jgi:formylglycine-generating enzyme required for sulfatase activity
VGPIEGEALVCEVLTAASDADGDSLGYTFSWTVDGVAYAGASSTLRAGDTVLSGETLPDELWTCAATANDGSASGAAGEDDVLVDSDCVNDGTVTLTSSGVQFVTVCGGTFDMGCTPGQSSCYADESPVRETTLTRDYYMSRTEVTQGQFQAVMGYNPSYFPSCGSTCPVEQLTWHEAAAFTNAMSAASGRRVIRPPTSTSWQPQAESSPTSTSPSPCAAPPAPPCSPAATRTGWASTVPSGQAPSTASVPMKRRWPNW